MLAALLLAAQGPGAMVVGAGAYAMPLEVTPEEGPVVPAIEARYSRAFARCQDAARVTADNARCFVDEFARADAALNAAWPKALARARDKAGLRLAQRQWVKARDPFCRRQSDGFSGGTIAPVVWASCRVELTIRRTMWLEKLPKS